MSPPKMEMDTALEQSEVSSLATDEKVSAVYPTGAAPHSATTMNEVSPSSS